MAEFVKVMNDYWRMCLAHDCESCPLVYGNSSEACRIHLRNHPEVCEPIIEKWAAEHPDPDAIREALRKCGDGKCDHTCLFDGEDRCLNKLMHTAAEMIR